MTAEEQRNLEVVSRLGELWNAADHDRILELYREDVVMTAAPEWPEPGPWVGKEQVDSEQRQWLDAWDTVELIVGGVDAAGDKVLVTGEWVSRGAASGLGGSRPVAVVFTLEDGLVARFAWFADAASARQAAGIVQ
jgi:ketosteroid isomerase-like protein